MANFKFNSISYDKIKESIQWKYMIEAIDSPIDTNLLVYWLPWAWKSTIAAHRLDKFNRQNKNVIYLTYWKLLSEFLKQWIDDIDAKVKFNSFWKWFYEIRKKLNLNYIKIENIKSEDVKETFSKYIEKYGKFDVIIIDEWQDILQYIYEHIWILSNHISIFADDAQQIMIRTWENKMTEIIKWYLNTETYQLTLNRRNPKSLYEFALQLNPKNVEKWDIKLMENKPDPVIFFDCFDKQTELSQILNIINDNKSKNIAILFSQIEQISLFETDLKSENFYDYTLYNSESNFNINNFKSPLITTFKSVKWLEVDIVIIPNLYPSIEYKYLDNNQLFVAFTRAKEKLIITHHNWWSQIEKILSKFDSNTYSSYKIWIDSWNKKEISIEDIEF